MEDITQLKVTITGDAIRLDQFLKWAGISGTGGHAKALIQDGQVLVNGSVEIHRGRKLQIGDKVSLTDAKGPVYEVMGATENAP